MEYVEIDKHSPDWKQKYPDEVKAIIGLDMAVPGVYLHWKQEEIDQRIRFMKRMRSLNAHGFLFWYPLTGVK